MTFSQLRQKDVVNICDGRKLGRPFDIVLNDNACVQGIVVPGQLGMKSMFKSDRDGIVIPWANVRRIGDDVILVEIEQEEC